MVSNVDVEGSAYIAKHLSLADVYKVKSPGDIFVRKPDRTR